MAVAAPVTTEEVGTGTGAAAPITYFRKTNRQQSHKQPTTRHPI
jgi:hypothetical protein